MWVITYRKSPKHTVRAVTIYQLAEIEERPQSFSCDNSIYIATKTKAACILIYLHHFGYTWKERAQGVEVSPMHVIDTSR